MIAKQMVVRCSKCGRRFIRSMGGTRYMSGLFGLGAPLLCRRCESEQWQRNHPNAPTLGDIFKGVTGKKRKK